MRPLNISTAERVWFTEQDFFITDPAFFWSKINSAPVVGFDAGDERPLHPACIFTDRKLIELTTRYFGPSPIDHFYSFGLGLKWKSEPLILTEGFHHMQGISQNHSLIERGEDSGIFYRDRFRDYLKSSLTIDVPLNSNWVAVAQHEILLKEQV